MFLVTINPGRRIWSVFNSTAISSLLALTASLTHADTGAPDYDFFEKNIRPILAERCYKCHSAASEKLKGELLLDTKEGLLTGGESGKPAIIPGDAEGSLLIQAIRYKNEDLQMPPPKEGKLTGAQIADFVAWVNSGAPDPRTRTSAARDTQLPQKPHWAFQPLRVPPVPKVRQREWPQTPIDNFISSKLEENGLQPSPPAEKDALIRRATYDLTGLPPTMEEINTFLMDGSSSAFTKVVDRLLASPRYGERWGRHWLDVARYSDTKGYVYDREEKRFVHSYVYRDWVIRAFNEDLPYDRFLLLQIAADQIVPAGDSSLAAMGFLTVGRRFLGVTHDIIDDRIDVIARGALGLTAGCARCHDHKFDPIPTKDYYSLYGVFAGSTERTVPLMTSLERTEAYVAYETELQKRVAKLNDTFKTKRDELTDRLRAKAGDYLIAVLNVEKLPNEEFYEIKGADDLNPVIARQWQAWLFQTGKSFHPVFAPWHALAALSEKDFATQSPAILQRLTNDASHPLNPLVAKAFADNPSDSMNDVARLYGKLLADVDNKWRAAMQTAQKQNATQPTRLTDGDEEAIRQTLYSLDSPVNVPSGAIVDTEWFFDEPTRVELAKLQAEIDRWIITAPGAPPHAVTLEDRATQRNARVFLRGNPANKGEEVPRQFLQVATGGNREPFKIGSGRLELARAIASKENPLTARVMANRIWLQHFGTGLVRTPSDFGTRCEPPNHPELLDWLARRFMDDGWSVKKLHRLIMLSSVYQQSSDSIDEPTNAGQNPSQPAASAVAIDPENKLLWRMNPQRLDFEALRDSLLSASGELDLTLGGKPVNLFMQPISKRRTVYGFIDRQFLPGVYRVFDFANPDMHNPQRYTTTVPQQALFFMNNPLVLGSARALTGRPDVAGCEKPESRIERLYEIIYQRKPTARQVEAGLRFLESAETEPPPEPAKPVASTWQYGYGEYDEASKSIKDFQPLPYFTGEAWQGGPNWPDPKLGWVQITREGGHAGNDLQHAAIRRWVAPRDAVVSISGKVAHNHEPGDGVRAFVISSRAGPLGCWTLHHTNTNAEIKSLEVKQGDTVDFVVDFRANLNSDMFAWSPVIKLADSIDVVASSDYTKEWSAKKEFSGPADPPQPLTPWEKYAQVLLLANEFLFVD